MQFRNELRKNPGFTLIEMAVVMVIVGVIISIMASVLPSLIQSAKIRKNRAVLEKVDYALQGYVTANGRLPYADSGTDGNGDADTYFGNFPFRDLGLSSGDDVWGNRMKYGVYSDLTATSTSTLCSVLSTASSSAFDSAKLYVTKEDGTQTNVAYVIVSGGPKDLDGSNGFFDGYNGVDDAEFDDPERFITTSYDDFMGNTSFTILIGKNCTGGSSGGGGGSGVENSYTNGCTNGIDDDGDGLVDCSDPDCFGDPACLAGGENVKISTGSVPSGNLNSDYSVTFTASGGITPYGWELTANGGFTDFYVHPYTGHLSGTLSQCPGTYTIGVKVTDSTTDPAPTTDTKSFTVEVAKNLSVARTSGSGTDITWNSTTQEETFEVHGGHIGDIDWTLNTGGASGFAYNNTGNTTVIKKDGITTAGSYTFTLTATDHDCPTNTANIILTVTVTESGAGAPYTEGMESEWRFDECTTWDGSSYDVVDSLGNSNHYGKASGGVVAVHSGKICRAASFDGIDDEIMSDVLTGADIMTFNDQVTLACWFKSPGGGSGSPRLIEFSDSTGSSSWSTALCYDSDGSLRAWVSDETSGTRGGEIDYSSELYNDNEWHHVVYTYSAANGGNLYVDNVLKKTATDDPTTNIHNAETFVIGGYYSSTDHCFKGLIDEVMVYHRELSAAEISDLYDLTRSTCTGSCYTDTVAEYRMENYAWSGTAGEVLDSGSGGSNGVAASGGSGVLPLQTTPSGGKVCRAGVFTRVNDTNGGYLNLGDPADGDLDPGTYPWTISAWIKWDGSSGDNIIFNKENLYETRVNGGYVSYAWQPHWAWDGGTSFPVTANEWTYVTTVYDGSQQILYKNGVEVYSRTQAGAMGSNGSKLLIGARGDTSPISFFGGMIDEVKIYNRALAENEIKADKDETRDCAADSVFITTTFLSNGVINSAYSYTVAATGGTTPYGWELLSSGIPGLSIVPNTGELHGTIDKCAGTYSIAVRVTDAASRTDERTFTLTVANGTLTISPSAPKTFNCTTSDFYRDFTVSGSRLGALANWAVTWLGTNPGGFEVVKTGDATARFRKISTSTAGTGYQFKLTANDSTCTDNTIDSGYYTLNISGGGASTPYYTGHVGEWWLDESSGTIEDHSDQNNDGTAYGTVTYGEQGKVWTALKFDGSSGYVSVPDSPELRLAAPFTMALWVKVNAGASDWVRLAGKGNSTSRNYGLWLDTDGTILFQIYSAGGNGSCQTTVTVNDGDWHHVVGVYDDDSTTTPPAPTMKVYIDKAVSASTSYSQTPYISSDPFQMAYAGFHAYLNGWLDEVNLFNRALSPVDITDLYNQASLVAYYKMDETEGGTAPGGKDINDYSGQANHGTNNGASYGATGIIGNALEFDGTDYVNVGNNAVLTPPDISISAWVKASELDSWNGIITNKPDANHGINLQMGTSNNVSALVGDGSACTYVKTTWAPDVDIWYHIVITHNSLDNNILYVNGSSIDPPVTRALAYTTPVDTIIGRFYTGSLPFKGLIDEIRIYNRVLSAAEVTDLYSRGTE